MASGQSNQPSSSAGESPAGHESDGEFEPSAEMLVNEFDDEHTLDEEEELGEGDNEDEIDDLQREGEMPLEELMAMYGYQPGSGAASSTAVSQQTVTETTTSSSSQDSLKDTTSDPSDKISRTTVQVQGEGYTPVASEDTTGTSEDGSWIHNAVEMEGDDDDDEDDDDYEAYYDDDFEESSNEGRKTIQVGEEYQAVVPDGLCRYDDVPAYENEDKLLWDPTRMEDEVVEEYLRSLTDQPEPSNHSTSSESSTSSANAVNQTSSTPPSKPPVPDDEQALLLLLQSGHKADEAIRRRRMMSPKSSSNDTMTPWSGEETDNFEEGLRLHGKDFHQIQKNKVPTRKVQELVHFYYLWKKTERHDVFVSKYRIEKKVYSLHPTTTDYMDRFMEEIEAMSNATTNSSPTSAPSPSSSSASGSQPVEATFNHVSRLPLDGQEHHLPGSFSSETIVTNNNVNAITLNGVGGVKMPHVVIPSSTPDVSLDDVSHVSIVTSHYNHHISSGGPIVPSPVKNVSDIIIPSNLSATVTTNNNSSPTTNLSQSVNSLTGSDGVADINCK